MPPSLIKQVNDAFKALDRVGKNKRKATEKQKKEYIYHGVTMKNYIKHCCTFAKWAKERYCIKELSELTPEIGRYYLETMIRNGNSAYYIQTTKSAMKKLEKGIRRAYHKRRKLVPDDIELPQRRLHERKGRRAYTASQLNQIIVYAWEENPGAAKAFDIQEKFGLRISELLNLRKCDILFTQGILVVWRGKGGLLREVPFPETEQERKEAEKLLNNICIDKQEMDLLFGDLTQQELYRVLRYACQKAGIKHHKTHNFRHTYVVKGYIKRIKEGKSDYEARGEMSKKIGHRRRDVTSIYAPSHLSRIRSDE